MKLKQLPATRTYPPASKLPDKYAVTVGHVVFTWAQIEHFLFMIEKRLQGVDIKTARKTLAWRTATKTLRSVQDAAKQKSFTFTTNIENIKTLFSDTEDGRNILCHSRWFSNNTIWFVQCTKGVSQHKGIKIDRANAPVAFQVETYLPKLLKDARTCFVIAKQLLSETERLVSSGKG